MHRIYIYFFRRQKADNHKTRQLFRYYEMWDVIVFLAFYLQIGRICRGWRMYKKELPGWPILRPYKKVFNRKYLPEFFYILNNPKTRVIKFLKISVGNFFAHYISVFLWFLYLSGPSFLLRPGCTKKQLSWSAVNLILHTPPLENCGGSASLVSWAYMTYSYGVE